VGKRGQVTIFVIIAIVIVAAVILIFAFRGNLFGTSIPAELQPVYSFYSECLALETENALNILGTQGGRIESGEFAPGSDFAPYSSHLNFLSIPVPYWYYVSSNGIVRENVPSVSEMETEVENFIAERINDCDFSDFYSQGFYITLNEPSVEVSILDGRVDVSVSERVEVSRGEVSAVKTNHEVSVESKIGKFHGLALDVYNKQIEDAFLEDYTIDVLRLYAPVDGVLVQCSPATWRGPEVVDELRSALESNIGAIRFGDGNYQLSEADREYFVVDSPGVDEQVGFLYSSSWPTRVEIVPTEGELLYAEPVGNQEGLGAMGFCYVPYHFVYDIGFPVMVQILDGNEFFQFPVVVIVDNNVPRQANLQSIVNEPDFDLCEFQNAELEVRTFDVNLNPVEASVSYECFEQSCRLGDTVISGDSAVLSTNAPQCVNGYVAAKSEGYADKKVIFSTNVDSSVDVILDREHEVSVDVRVGGIEPSGLSVVTFDKEDGDSVTAILPDDATVSLSEGQYTVSVYSYGESAIVIPESVRFECNEIPSGGIGGFLGQTEERCYEVTIPRTVIDTALTGGGSEEVYILESQIEQGSIRVLVDSLPKPTSLQQLQVNQELLNTRGVDLIFG